MTITAKLRARVRAGMAFLDAIRPTWRKKINLKELDLSAEDCCVLGEVYGSYYTGRDQLLDGDVPQDGTYDPYDDDAREKVLDARAEALGLYTSNDKDYPRLTRIWREEYRKGQRRTRASR